MNNISIKCLKSKKIHSSSYHGQFVIHSLKPGQGLTIGNQLRRVLLNDLGGTAISAIRIANVTNEFSLIPGVREDILELLLNLKGIVFKSKKKDIQFGRLKVQGPAVITADLLQLPVDLKVINPTHYIATISKTSILEIEFKFEYGTGYKLASQTFINETDEYLQLDTIFMPIQKVNFTIENLYDTNNIISEQLLLDVWTNGSILPTEAITLATQIIIDLFKSLISDKNHPKNIQSKSQIELIKIKPYANIAIEELELSVRAYNCLKKAKINTISDLLKYSPKKLQELKNFGQKSADEVFFRLKNKLGISLD